MKRMLRTIIILLIVMPFIVNAEIVLFADNVGQDQSAITTLPYYVYYYGLKSGTSCPSGSTEVTNLKAGAPDASGAKVCNFTSSTIGNFDDIDGYVFYWDQNKTPTSGHTLLKGTPLNTTNIPEYLCECTKGTADNCCEIRKNVLKIYASECKKTFTIRFNTNNGTTLNPIEVTGGSSVSIPTPTALKDGSKFEGWYTDSDFKNKFNVGSGFSSDEYGCFEDITLYAKWTGITEDCPPTVADILTISFDSKGGNAIGNVEVDVMSEVSKTVSLPTPIKNGYQFLGWYTGSSKITSYYNSILIQNSINIYDDKGCPKGKKITLVAQWKKEGCPEITNSLIIKYETYDKKDGYVLEGWYLDKELTIKAEYKDTDELKEKYSAYLDAELGHDECPTGNYTLTLYPKLEKEEIVCKESNDFQLEYYLDDSNGSNFVLYSSNEYLDKFKEPTREGYDFVEWYKDKDLTQSIKDNPITEKDFLWSDVKDNKGCITSKKGIITLYAKWNKIENTQGGGTGGGSQNDVPNPKTGAATPYIAIVLGIIGISAIAIKTKKKNKLLKI